MISIRIHVRGYKEELDMSKMLLIPLSILLLALPCAAEISAKIIDYSDSAVIFTPVYILGVIENNESQPVLLPIALNRDLFVEVSNANEQLLTSSDENFDWGEDEVVWLGPGEKYYFMTNLGSKIQKSGVYELRFVSESSGNCMVNIDDNRSKKFPLEFLGESNGNVRQCKCWSGKVRSQIVKVLVTEPATQEDKDALQYFVEGYVGKSRSDFDENADITALNRKILDSRDELVKLFPNSEYTYVAGIYSAQASIGQPYAVLDQTMKLQPNHPLTRFLKVEAALDALESSLIRGVPVNNDHFNSAVIELNEGLIKYFQQEKKKIELLAEINGK